MRIGLIAPPFISVPRGYGGTELFIVHLAEGLARLSGGDSDLDSAALARKRTIAAGQSYNHPAAAA